MLTADWSVTVQCKAVSRDCKFAAQSSPSLNFWMQQNVKLFARACVFGLTHSHAYEWMSMERKVQCDRPLWPNCVAYKICCGNMSYLNINPNSSEMQTKCKRACLAIFWILKSLLTFAVYLRWFWNFFLNIRFLFNWFYNVCWFLLYLSFV